ncbi:MAG: ADP-ribosylglycohydrolase family protein [Bacilli bacterium]|nr:ADP-ribosylglycohydrolase family protein [Bacilli bacterium]
MYDKIESKNGIIGFAVGDALGTPIEFMDRSRFIDNPVTEMLGNMSHKMPKGSWSDDTSMTLATVDAIITDETNTYGHIFSSALTCKTIADNFVKWLEKAEYTPTGRTFGVGNVCLKAISKYHGGVANAESCGCDGEMDNGNGSLMRMIPIIYYCDAHCLSDKQVYEMVKKVSSITHSNEVSVLGCYIYVYFGIGLLNGWTLEQAYEYIQSIWYEEYFDIETIERYKRIIDSNIKDEKAESISSSGYVLHTLEATFWSLLNTDSYDSAVIKAINLGDDADTVGGCVGGLAGIYYGMDSINENWRKELLKYDYIEDMCQKLDDVLNPILQDNMDFIAIKSLYPPKRNEKYEESEACKRRNNWNEKYIWPQFEENWKKETSQEEIMDMFKQQREIHDRIDERIKKEIEPYIIK